MTDIWISGVVIEREVVMSIDELAQACAVSIDYIEELVGEDILRPSGSGLGDWQFGGRSLRRVKICLRLQHDLGVNLPGIAVILDLLEQRGLHSDDAVPDTRLE